MLAHRHLLGMLLVLVLALFALPACVESEDDGEDYQTAQSGLDMAVPFTAKNAQGVIRSCAAGAMRPGCEAAPASEWRVIYDSPTSYPLTGVWGAFIA